ncbi:uncharacterized protein TRIADDRAFT_54734 [Trichoplax adhaerens]|uniref:FZ domain-containing protein n=1 Tax=Trichoplax adhaerens TaxID=10228 RepID=B3RSU6_TRIAD|nr:predicted protein [Trichoplax adhaerens]EDV27107.1 predicted protein [Trichoplax adhaerens]|eukprot:XP_002111103.1 predicted protein [Trichoplax adhaerens]
MLKFLLTTLAILLAIKANIGEALKDKEQLAMEAVEHIRQIRSSRPVVGLPSSVRSFCGTDYNSPTYYVDTVGATFSAVQLSFSLLQHTLSSNYTNALKTILCGGAFPKCSADSSTATNGNFQSACSALNSCGSNFPNLGPQSFLQYCNESGKTFSLRTCSKFKAGTFSSQYCEALPANITFPYYYSVENLAARAVAISALQTAFSNAAVTSTCGTKWTNIACVLIPSCSSDRTTVLSAVTKQQCQDAINCLPSSLQNSYRIIYNCSAYPDSNSTTVCTPSGEAYRSAGITVPTCTLLTDCYMDICKDHKLEFDSKVLRGELITKTVF